MRTREEVAHPHRNGGPVDGWPGLFASREALHLRKASALAVTITPAEGLITELWCALADEGWCRSDDPGYFEVQPRSAFMALSSL